MYSVIYHESGLPVGINLNGMYIPLDANNAEFQKFLLWNAVQGVPLDYVSSIAPASREPSLSPSQQIILADGIDMARVVVTGEPGATVDYTVNGEPFSETLNESGLETIELTCDTPNTTLLVQAGTARAVIYAVEVPA